MALRKAAYAVSSWASLCPGLVNNTRASAVQIARQFAAEPAQAVATDSGYVTQVSTYDVSGHRVVKICVVVLVSTEFATTRSLGPLSTFGSMESYPLFYPRWKLRVSPFVSFWKSPSTWVTTT
jgi:hypothetical protein